MKKIEDASRIYEDAIKHEKKPTMLLRQYAQKVEWSFATLYRSMKKEFPNRAREIRAKYGVVGR